MTDLHSVLEGAASGVNPSPAVQRRITSLADSLLRKTRKAAARYSETRGVVLGGSFAKGTWLPKYVDLDIFVKVDPSTPESRFEEVGLAVGSIATRGFPRGKKYAQHPYTEATIDSVRVNIVPCYAVNRGEWKSAADRSPYHVQLVKGLSQDKKTQIRLLKRFMKAIGVYGAEIQVQGFSGYVAEVLVLKHEDLEGVLSFFANFKPSGKERLFTLPDPVDERRDLAIAISPEKLGRMVLAAREFLSRPSTAFFRQMQGKDHPSMRKEVVALPFSHQELSEDTLWGELRKTTRHIVRHLEVSGFRIARSMAASDNARSSAILLIPEFFVLPELEQRVGPTVDRGKDVEAFLASNRKDAKL
ncbi:MAG: CCA tRNA nucleotidyltransferase, partial [Thaumarchaeota archaeon]|nr:CCA tRNA nucleotidyltransferase [Nitrososphaerota archaeon]